MEAWVGGIDWTAMNGLGVADLMMRLAVAMVLGALVGLERERLERAAGFRTHALVCVASALIMVVSTYGFAESAVLDPSRIAAQVVSGIGFLGAGVIILRKNTVRGLTTAASLWAVAGVGLAAGSGLYIAAGAGTLFMLIVQAVMRPIESYFFAHQAERQRIFIETDDVSRVFAAIPTIASRRGARVQTIQFERHRNGRRDIVELTIRMSKHDERYALVDDLQKLQGVIRVRDGVGMATLRRPGRHGVEFPADDPDDGEDDDSEV
jgi:putative Mg2+ transporter-C (MgtC) family protein